jgi:hypothetical protein
LYLEYLVLGNMRDEEAEPGEMKSISEYLVKAA